MDVPLLHEITYVLNFDFVRRGDLSLLQATFHQGRSRVTGDPDLVCAKWNGP
jgi:hypothetical protein